MTNFPFDPVATCVGGKEKERCRRNVREGDRDV